MLPRMIHSKPSWMPRTSTPSSWLRMVAAPTTALMPGAGPPLTRMARFLLWLTLPVYHVRRMPRRPGRLDAGEEGQEALAQHLGSGACRIVSRGSEARDPGGARPEE